MDVADDWRHTALARQLRLLEAARVQGGDGNLNTIGPAAIDHQGDNTLAQALRKGHTDAGRGLQQALAAPTAQPAHTAPTQAVRVPVPIEIVKGPQAPNADPATTAGTATTIDIAGQCQQAQVAQALHAHAQTAAHSVAFRPPQEQALPLSLLQAVEHQDAQGLKELIARLRRQKKDVATVLNQAGKLHDAEGNVTAMESTPLLTAVRLGNVTLAAILVNAGAAPEQIDAEGATALAKAIEHGHAGMADALLEAGARVDGAAGHQGWTPLMQCVDKGDANLVQVVLGWVPEINHVSACGWTALTLAARGGCLPIVKLLLSANARVDLCERSAKVGANPHGINHDAAVMVAVEHGHADIVKRLLQAGASREQTDSEGRSVWVRAAQLGQVPVMYALIDMGFSVGQTDAMGWTALMHAACKNKVAALQGLMDKGATVDQTTPDGTTALMFAAMHRQIDAIRLLLKHGANPMRVTANGETLLIDAARQGHADVVQVLLEIGMTPAASAMAAPLAMVMAVGASGTTNAPADGKALLEKSDSRGRLS